MSSPVRRDDDGFVRGFPYHDGLLLGILTSNDSKETRLLLRATDGQQRVLTLLAVRALHVDGFRQGNIVHTMQVVDAGRAATIPELARLLVQNLYLDPIKLDPNDLVFWLKNSYGADVVCVCRDLSIGEPGAVGVLA